MFLCEPHHAESECSTDHMMRSWGPCEICTVTGEYAGHASTSCYDCHSSSISLPEPEATEEAGDEEEDASDSRIQRGSFCAFRSAKGAWCWEPKGHLGPHADGAGHIMLESQAEAIWNVEGKSLTSSQVLRQAAQSHPDDRLSGLLGEIATVLDRREP